MPMKAIPPLTPREHLFLWLMAQGYTPSKAASEIGITPHLTRCLGTRVRAKMGALTNAHAVALAYQRDMLGEYLECGSERGYRAHVGRSEDPSGCRACRRAHTEYVERNEELPRYFKQIKFTEGELRLLRSMDSGRSQEEMAKVWGVTRKRVEALATQVFKKLDVTQYPPQARRRAALDEARRRGLLRPVPGKPAPKPPVKRKPPQLTVLELKMLKAVDGHSISEAGEELGYPRAQVASRLARIYQKLEVDHLPRDQRRPAALAKVRDQFDRV